MKIKVRELKKEVSRKRVDGEKLVKYKLLEVADGEASPSWKVTDVSTDHDSGNRMGGTFYLTQAEFDKLASDGASVKVIPVDEALVKHEIPMP
jgi:hypothetical protein